MVSLTMAHSDGGVSIGVAEDVIQTSTKKSLRLSKKKQLTLIKKTEELQRREKEEQQKIENDRKDKDEENNTMEIDDYDTEAKGKQKRHWESWAKADKDLFFEAISEFGKDFDKICSFMDKKVKTRGKSVKDCEPRNKDQIRYFYYRTWKQISKAVSLQPSESKRIQHEIYCMICYGELRKKCQGFGNKDLKKLDELVRNGSTTVRHKGRKIRIKPPNCRFLKKLSDEEDKSTREQGAIPENIDVELYPRTNREWTMAQRLAFNPRVRLHGLPITLKVKSLMKLLLRRFEKRDDESTACETTVRLFPPKDFLLIDDNTQTPLKTDCTPKESLRAPLLENIVSGSGALNLSPGSISSENRKETVSEQTVAHFSPSNNEVSTQGQITSCLKSSMPNSKEHSLINAAPTYTTSFPVVSNPPIPAACTSPKGQNFVSSTSAKDKHLASQSIDTSLNVSIGSLSTKGNSTPESMTLGNVTPILSTGIPTVSSTQSSSLVDKNTILAGQSTSELMQGSVLGGNVINVSATKTQDSMINLNNVSKNSPTTICTESSVSQTTYISDGCVTALKKQCSALDGNIITTISDSCLSSSQTVSVSHADCNTTADTSSKAQSSSTIVFPTRQNDMQQKSDQDIEMDLQEVPFFPITLENCVDKDLQACCLALDRPDVIRLEYEVEVKQDNSKRPALSSFDKLVLLAQRDLCKALKVSTQQIKAASAALKSNQLSRSVEVVKPSQAVKPIYIAATFAEPTWVPLPRHGLQDGIPTGTKPIFVSASSLKPSVVGVGPALKNVVKQRRVAPRLRPIQPASKTLMAKAVAVNIVPQPAQLAQYAQVPAVSTQLVNSGSNSLAAANLTSSETLSTTTSTRTNATFSAPSTPLSSQLTIWGCPTTESTTSSNVQVEVIEEGIRSKATAKRLRPTSVLPTEEQVKIQRLESSNVSKEEGDAFDLSFLGPDEESRPGNPNASDSINLSSILSGLTKNLCKNTSNEPESIVTNSMEPVGDPHKTVAVSTSVAPPQSQLDVETIKQAAVSTGITTTSTKSTVLTTPVKGTAKTPSKNENSVDCYKIQPVAFDPQWFGGEMSDLSLGGILDVGNFNKEAMKSSDSTQASDISMSTLLNVNNDKSAKETSPSPVQVSEVSLGSLLGKDDSNKDFKSQGTELSIRRFLGTLQKDDSTKAKIVLPETPKSCSSDSLLMKPDTDPVTVFESLMNENSVDYINKFKDLTAKLKAEEASNKAAKVFPASSNAPVEEEGLKNDVVPNTPTTINTKDPRLPIYTSEDSVGPLDDLSFVLPTNDSNSNDFAKGFA